MTILLNAIFYSVLFLSLLSFLFYVLTTHSRCFGCEVIEGYGMTETTCVISMMDEGDTLSGHVGSPSAACGELMIIVEKRVKKKHLE